MYGTFEDFVLGAMPWMFNMENLFSIGDFSDWARIVDWMSGCADLLVAEGRCLGEG